MPRNYVYSTLTSPVRYVNHTRGGAEIPLPVSVDGEDGVLIHGGHGVASKRLVTPLGVMTEVTDVQLTYLQENQVFQMHVKNGFVTVDTVKADPEKVAADMAGKDGSAPLTPADFDGGQGPKVMDEEPAKARGKGRR